MLEKIIQWDQDLLITLNNLNHPFFDPIMYWFSDKYIWFPMYIFFIGFLIYRYKIDGLYMVVALAFTIALCDQFTSGFMKPYFERLRPCYEPEIQNYLRMITGCGGQYGFASSHASNAFGFAVFTILLLRKNSYHIGWLLLWALLVSYSRVYLGVHYPLDILAGGMSGTIFAIFMYSIFRVIKKKRQGKNSLPSET
jgi:undecaprenyl-diphosphatase